MNADVGRSREVAYQALLRNGCRGITAVSLDKFLWENPCGGVPADQAQVMPAPIPACDPDPGAADKLGQWGLCLLFVSKPCAWRRILRLG